MWSVVKNYPKYLINNEGIVLSSVRGFRELKPYKDKDGYLQVCLSKNNKRKRHSVHRLVAQAFILKTHNDRNVVNHKNSVRDDNRCRNLEWVTVKENNTHGIKFGKLSQKGEENKNSKLTTEQVIEIKNRLLSGEQYIQIAPDYQVTVTTIGRIARKENWKHI